MGRPFQEISNEIQAGLAIITVELGKNGIFAASTARKKNLSLHTIWCRG
jgi:hypothetical protein